MGSYAEFLGTQSATGRDGRVRAAMDSRLPVPIPAGHDRLGDTQRPQRPVRGLWPGQTAQELVWAQNVYKHTGKPVLMLTPLGVTFQMVTEAAKFGMEAAISRDGTAPAVVTVTNYEQLEKFDRDQFGGVVCDESSADQGFRRGAPRGRDRLPPEDALPAAGHRHGRPERLHRTRHLIEALDTSGTRTCLAGSSPTRRRPSSPWAASGGPPPASSGGSRVTPRSSSGGGWRRGRGPPGSLRSRVRGRGVHSPAAGDAASRRGGPDRERGNPVRRARGGPAGGA